jgi:hypothetical protein
MRITIIPHVACVVCPSTSHDLFPAEDEDGSTVMGEPADYLLDFPDIKLVRDASSKYPMVKSASLKRLVEHLTNGEYPGTFSKEGKCFVCVCVCVCVCV